MYNIYSIGIKIFVIITNTNLVDDTRKQFFWEKQSGRERFS